MGPEGGSQSGRVIFSGTPAERCRAPNSLTGKHLSALGSDASDPAGTRMLANADVGVAKLKAQ